MEIFTVKQKPFAVINGTTGSVVSPIAFRRQDFWAMRLLLNFYGFIHKTNHSRMVKKSRKSISNTALLTTKRDKSGRVLTNAYESLANPVLLLNRNGKIKWVNNSFKQLSGLFTEGNIISSTEKYLQNEVMDFFWPVIKEKKTLNYEYKGHTPEGTVYWLHLTASPLLNENKKAEQVVIIGTDITAAKQREEGLVFANKMAEHSLRKGNKALDKLSKAKNEAEHYAKMKDRFFACMSHEIRTPMNGILGLTELLMKTPLCQEQKEYLGTMKTTGESLLVVINDVLDLSKIEAGKIIIENTPFYLPDVISSVINIFRVKAKEKNISLRKEIDHELTTSLLGDPFRLSQVLMNLVGNAVKFTEKGEVTLIARIIRETAENLTVEMRVQDTGIGIPKEKMSSLFSEFMQAHSSPSAHPGGIGLGLAISKKLVMLQGGSIAAESTENKGSRFTVVITYKKSATERIKKSTGTGKNETEANVENLTGISVLLAEDNAVNQLVGQRLLNDAGACVDIAINGKLAIEMLKTKKYDVVLMDIRMPEMDGFQATQYIRNHLKMEACQLPVIALTAYTGNSEIKKCLQAGMNDYVSKPFKMDELCTKIKKAVHTTKKTIIA